MRLLLLDQFSDPGGAQQGLLELLPSIRARGWDALVGLPGDGELFDRVRALGFPAERVLCGPYSSGQKTPMDMARFVAGTPLLSQQISELAERVRAELVYINGPRLLPAAALASRRTPVLFHAHSYVFPGAMRQLAGTSLRQIGARVVGSCRFVAEPWREWVGSSGLSVIYNGVAPPDVRTDRQVRTRNRIGCLGRIAPEKGQLEFLKAAAIIHRSLPDCRFSIYGAALFSEPGALQYDAQVRAAAAGLPVEFPGWVSGGYTALAELDLLLVPSAGHEATTRVILEAFAAGVPVIAFRAGGIPEVVDEDIDGLLADSAEEMARQAIKLLGNDRARLAEMSGLALDTWQRRFTLERYHNELLSAMEEAAGKAARRAKA